MDFEPSNHCSVQETEQRPDTNGREDPKRGRGATAGRTIRGQYQGSAHCRQSVNGPDRKIDSARDNHHRHSNRHDRKETGVFGNLDNCARVEKFVNRLKGWNALTCSIGLENSFALAVRSRLEFRQLNRTAENCQKQSEHNDYYNETALREFRKIETEFAGGRHRIGNIGLCCEDTLPNRMPVSTS